MSVPVETGLTYEDLERLPDDNVIREIIDGELFVTPPPLIRHQWVAGKLFARLFAYAQDHGGLVLQAPTGVFLTERDVVEPDVLFVLPEHAPRVEESYIRGAPDLVVEVSSPSTRRNDLVRKRALYERHGVPEYWFVDLDTDRVEVHVLEDDRYPAPRIVEAGDQLASAVLRGFTVDVGELVAGPEL